MRYYGEKCLDHFSPAGLKVLVVDDDPFCLAVLDRMLRECKYAVTTCSRATTALTMLRERKESFDVVISDVHMPDMDGFKLLELIGLELGLPVIMMSANGETDVVMKGVVYGACDYLVKPVRMEELRNIWQHVVRRRTKNPGAVQAPEEWEDFMKSTPTDSSEDADQIDSGLARKKKRLSCLSDGDESVRNIHSSKKARVVWSFDLHQQFVKAINHIGIDKAVPKRILEVMNIQGLTRENVASHLQKYRLYLKRLSGINPEPFPIASFRAYENSTFGGTMQIQQPSAAASKTTLLRSRSSPAAAGAYNAATVATLKQLQALQQAAHERSQLDFVGGGGGGVSCGSGAAAAIPRPCQTSFLADSDRPEFGGGDDDGDDGHASKVDRDGQNELFVRLKDDESLRASFHGTVFHRHHI